MFLSNQIYLVAEDRLGLAFGRRLVREQPSLIVWRELDAGGNGNLRADASKYSSMAVKYPVLMLTDLDNRQCCACLFDDWFGLNIRPHNNFLLRVCVREAEAWLLAHPELIANLFNLRLSQLPAHPENLTDPKAELLKLAKKAPARIRKGLLPAEGSTAKIGPEYNDILCPLVLGEWDICIAAQHAPSLARARLRLAELAGRVTS